MSISATRSDDVVTLTYPDDVVTLTYPGLAGATPGLAETTPGLAAATAAASALLAENEHLVQTGARTFAVVPGRNGVIIGRVIDGESYAIVARDHGISAERVRQLAAPYMAGEEVTAARKANQRRRAAGKRAAKVRDYARTHPDATVSEIAKRASLNMEQVIEILGPDAARHSLRAEHAIVFSDDDCFRALRRAAGPDGAATVSMTAYARANEGFEAPSAYNLVVRFGSWSAACEAAGVVAGAAPRRSYSQSWSDGELRDWVTRFFDDVGLDPLPSMPQFRAWAETQPGKAPSTITIRNRLGRWSDLIRGHLSR